MFRYKYEKLYIKNALVRAMRVNDMDIDTLAEMAKLSRLTIIHAVDEDYENMPSTITLLKLSKVLGVPMGKFFSSKS